MPSVRLGGGRELYGSKMKRSHLPFVRERLNGRFNIPKKLIARKQVSRVPDTTHLLVILQYLHFQNLSREFANVGEKLGCFLEQDKCSFLDAVNFVGDLNEAHDSHYTTAFLVNMVFAPFSSTFFRVN